MNIFFCGGGTSGHIMPAVAIAEKFEEKDPDTKITFIVRRGGKENDVLKKRNKAIREIDIMGLKRKITLENFERVKKAFSAVKECQKIIDELRPDCIIGTGGYVCWPMLIAGRRRRIPTFLHESNIYPGLVTKLLSTKCDKVFLSNAETKKILPRHGNYSVVGNPLLKEYSQTSRKSARTSLHLKPQEKLIVSFGGSIGAEKLNDIIIDVMKEYSSKEKNVKHIHATGARLYNESLKKWNLPDNDNCTLLPYIENMPTILWAADLVICRAGAMTISEISATGAPSIVIPSPHVAGNHQYKNAKILSDKNAIIMLEEKDLTAQNLLEKAKSILEDNTAKQGLSRAIKSIGNSNSADLIYNEVKNHLK